MVPGYAELHCLSNFTFLRGASHPEELVARAHALGYAALALTDECSVSGVVRAHLAARERGLHLIVGTEVRLADGPKLVLLATDREGYARLSELVTTARRAAPKGRYRLVRTDLDGGLPRCLALWVPPQAVAEAEAVAEAAQDPWLPEARWVAQRFPGAAWIAVELLRGPDDAAHLARLHALGREAGLPLVAAGDVHLHVRARKRLQDVLTAIRLGVPVARAGRALLPNSERHLRPIGRLAHLYPAQLLVETLEVASRCTFDLDELRYEYPEELVPAGRTPASHLRALTMEGLARRYPRGVPQRVSATVEHELALVRELAYEPYFLTVHDIVRFARERGILCQGRGSAANSAVCYALGITEVDPGRMQVLFERFVSKERNEPPDIDVDFEHERREEVMQYLYAKYGRERAGLTATLITYRPKSALRDVGKALGLSLDQVDRLSGTVAWWEGGRPNPERLAEAGFDPESPVIGRLVDLAHELLGFPRHLSQHTGGFVIARDRLSRLVPIENAAMPERTVIQWDKYDLDALGLLKVDVLALGMLSAIRRALDLVNDYRSRGAVSTPAPCSPSTPRSPHIDGALTMADIPPEDPATYDMICRGDTLGVFQIESRAQMAMLPRLKPRCFYDLVIEVAIVRPGPIQGRMVHPYLKRREGTEPVTYPSEAVRGVLERTLGVSIFQEQVMQLAVVAAGFTPGEADALRRAMAAWKRKGGLEPFRDRLLAGMLARGYGAEYAEQIFQQIRGFGEYGFPESHAASFALLVYVSAWLKCHEPAAFAAALLNAQPLGFYAPAQIVQDARRHGVEVRPVDVLASAWDCTLEPGGSPAIRLGLRQVKGLSRAGAQRLVEARGERAFEDAEDLARRAGLDRRDLDSLARAGALAGLAGHRRHALWAVLGIDRPPPVLEGARLAEPLPRLEPPGEGEEIVADYATLGLTLGRHPLALLRGRLARLRALAAADLGALPSGRPVRVAGLVTCRQRPATARGVTFVTLEDETGFVNVVVWAALADRQRRELLGASLMGVAGRLERQGEVTHVIADRLYDHSPLLGRLQAPSRDFH